MASTSTLHEPAVCDPGKQKAGGVKEGSELQYLGEKGCDHTVVRFATSWATKEEDIRKLLALM